MNYKNDRILILSLLADDGIDTGCDVRLGAYVFHRWFYDPL